MTTGGTPNATPTQWFNAGPSPVAGPTAAAGAATNLGGGTTTPTTGISGPITSIVADPNDSKIIFATASGGGVWKTTNGGITWTPLFDNMSTVQSLRINGADPTTDSFSLTYIDPFTAAVKTTAALPFNATAELITAALGQIVGMGNSVSVDQVITQGKNEVQEIVLNTTASIWTPNSTESFSFNGQTTSNNNAFVYRKPGDGCDSYSKRAQFVELHQNGGLGKVTVECRRHPNSARCSTDEAFLVTFVGNLASSRNR